MSYHPVRLWISGRYVAEGDWELNGVFSSESGAVAACRDKSDFIAPIMLDERAPEERTYMSGMRYPILPTDPA